MVALVGDSSIVNGLSLEGLNNAGTLNRQLLVVLNDNGMSIGMPQGALAGYFDKIRVHPRFTDLKSRALDVLKRLPAGGALEQIYNRVGEMTKAALDHTHLFDHFGLLCIGPVDGHDLPTLIEMLEDVKKIDRPVLLHVKTIKGKGFEFSSTDPTTFHSPKPFRVNGCSAELITSGRSFTKAYADALTDVMERDDQGGRGDRRYARRHRPGRGDGGPVSRTDLRRRHRRIARGGHVRRHGQGRVSSRSPRFTRPSCNAASTRSSRRWRWPACRSASAWTAPDWSAETGPCTTGSSTSPSCAAFPGWR